MKACPYCAEQIQDEAIVCRYCNRDLREPVAPPAAPPPVIRAAVGIDAKLANLEDQRRRAETELSKYSSARSVGLLGILIGLLLAGFVNLWLGGFLILAGILATISNATKASSTQQEVANLTRQIEQRRAAL